MAKLATRRFPYLRPYEVFYLLVQAVGIVYWATYFFFGVHLPAARYVLGVTRFLSLYFIIMLIDRSRYHDGYIYVTQVEDKKMFTLELDAEPEEIAEMDLVTFRVQDNSLAD